MLRKPHVGGGYAVSDVTGVLQFGYPYYGDTYDDHESIKKGIDLWKALN